MGRPLYGFLFKHQEHLDDFNSYIRGKVNSGTLQDASSSGMSHPTGVHRDNSTVGVMKHTDSVEMSSLARTDSDLRQVA